MFFIELLVLFTYIRYYKVVTSITIVSSICGGRTVRDDFPTKYIVFQYITSHIPFAMTSAVLLIILSIFLSFVRCDSPPRTFMDRLRTSDALYWGDNIYDHSPLNCFAGFDTLFSDYPKKLPLGIGLPDLTDTLRPKGYYTVEEPVRREKTYSILWKIVGDSLYANEIYFYLCDFPRWDADYMYPDHRQYRTLERLTGGRFSETNPAARVAPEAPHGVMPAVWVSGDFFIKQARTYDEKWPSLPVWRLTFDKGRLIKVKKERFR